MQEYQVEDNEVIIILGEDRIELYSPMMDDADKMVLPIPEHVQFATALVYLIKTDIEFRVWVTEKWMELLEKWTAQKAEEVEE
jgi:precorrin-6B methylase 1